MYYIGTFLNNIKNLEPFLQGLIAILIVLGGWLIAAVLKRIVIVFLKRLKFDQVIKRLGWQDTMEKADFYIDASKFFGKIVEWVVFLVFLMIAFDIAGVSYIAAILTKIVGYLPNIVIASLIFIVAVFLSDFSYRIVIASTGKKISYSKILGGFFRTVIWVFAILAILLQLGIAPDIIRAIVYGLILMVALAGGLAFGLGGKEFVAEFLRKVKDKLS